MQSTPSVLGDGRLISFKLTPNRENLPKHLRFKSLTEQVGIPCTPDDLTSMKIMADDRIRRKIKERFHRQQKLAGAGGCLLILFASNE